MRFWLTVLLGLALLAPQASEAQGKRGKKKQAGKNPEAPVTVDLGEAKLAGELPAQLASDSEKQSDWPAIAYAADGALWTVYVEWNDKDRDRIVVRRRDPQGGWGAPVGIDDGQWDHYFPALAARKDGVLAVWSGQSEGNFELYAAEVPAAGKAGRVERITRAPHADFNVRAVADSKGNVTLVWQSYRAGNSDIYARRLEGGQWGPEVRISESAFNDWEPAVAVDSRGVAWISYDTYQAGNYDVVLRSFNGRAAGPLVWIATGSAAQFHTSVAVDREDRVWVAWDDGGENWGKDFSRASSAPGSRGLHFSRNLGVRAYANGRLTDASAGLQQVLTGRMTRYAELPHLTTDASGALWLVFRHWTYTRPNEIFHFYATRLSEGRWSLPYRLANSSGHNSQQASLAVAPAGGITAAYASDGRSATNLPKDQMHALHYSVYVADLPKGDGPPQKQFTAAQVSAPTSKATRRPRQTMTIGGRSYHLLMGDAHRHTDIRGHSGVDGSVLDTYRYAMDAAQLDWLGTADHNEAVGGRWPDGLRDYQWWYTQKMVDLMTHAPTFIGVYSYEHSMARPAGHRNILFLKRGAPLRPIDREKKAEDNLPPNLWKWMEGNVFTMSGQQAVIAVQAQDEILRIDVVKDGKYVYTTRPGGRTASVRYRDNETKAGTSYYYLRVFQRDPENPDGDPEIAWVSPFYVTYR